MIIDSIYEALRNLPKDDRKPGVHPSAVTSKYACLRQDVLMSREGLTKNPDSPHGRLIFQHGHKIHSLIQTLLADSIGGKFRCVECNYTRIGFPIDYGIKVNSRNLCPSCGCEAYIHFEELEVSGELDLVGAVDFLFRMPDGEVVVVDIKSCASHTLNARLPIQSHVDQVTLYIGLINADKSLELPPVKRGCVFYFVKDNEEMRECHFEYDPEHYRYLIEEGVIPYRKVHIEGDFDTIPPIPYKCKPNTYLHKNCPVADLCKELKKKSI